LTRVNDSRAEGGRYLANGGKAAQLSEGLMSPRTIHVSRLIGLFTLVVAVSLIVDKPQAMATLLFLPQPATVRLVDWFRFDEFFYPYLGFAAGLGLYLAVHGFLAAGRHRA
jgi:hypothetical protein